MQFQGQFKVTDRQLPINFYWKTVEHVCKCRLAVLLPCSDDIAEYSQVVPAIIMTVHLLTSEIREWNGAEHKQGSTDSKQ